MKTVTLDLELLFDEMVSYVEQMMEKFAELKTEDDKRNWAVDIVGNCLERLRAQFELYNPQLRPAHAPPCNYCQEEWESCVCPKVDERARQKLLVALDALELPSRPFLEYNADEIAAAVAVDVKAQILARLDAMIDEGLKRYSRALIQAMIDEGTLERLPGDMIHLVSDKYLRSN